MSCVDENGTNGKRSNPRLSSAATRPPLIGATFTRSEISWFGHRVGMWKPIRR